MNKTIKLIFRNLFRNPVTSFINLFGLAVSLTLVIILAAYTYSEFTTDRFHDKHKNISLFLKSETGMWTPAVLKTAIEENVSGIDEVIRISETWEPPVFQTNNKQALKSDLIYSDKNFFDFFDYDEVEGNLSTALEEPMKIAISKDLANRLFGNERAVGKSLKLNNEHTLTVSAVFKQQKTNSFLSFNAISNISTRVKVDASPDELSQWGYNNYQTFIMTQDGSDLTDIAESIVELVPEGNRKRYAEAKLLPLEEIYFSGLKSSYTEYFTTGNKSQVLMLVIVAALVLIIALVNFINISSSQWHNKIKQTGILKIVGARKFSIVFKMLFETAMLFSIALLMALGIIRLIISFIFDYTAIQFDLKIIYSASFIGLVLLLVLAAGIMCGIVPALQIASSDAIVNLKKKLAVKRTGSAKQGALVAFQFVIAIVLIAFTLLVQKQVDFGSSNLGINQNNIVGIQLTPQLHKRLPTLKNELETQSGITKLSFTQFFPGNPVSTWGRKYLKNGEEKKIEFSTFSAESSLFDLMDIELLSGRFYNSEQASDKNKVVVNEQFLKQLNIENPVGGVIPYHRREDYEIVGVIKDFNYRAVNVPIGPLVIRNDAFCSYALMEINAADFKTLHTTLENVKTISANLSPAFPVEFSFFDRAIENMYQSEVKFRKAFTLFSLAAILISCLGILAMSLFATQNRIKEIGIRKVNGAKVTEILTMLNKDFIKWVAIAFVIACPIAYYTMNKWLENFAYKTTLSWWIFALAGILALGIALLTVSWQSWRAATRNPVEALRYE